MDNIDERLRQASDRCIKAYENWKTKETEPSKREELREAIHELRKVSSRLEIDMAVSEREEMAQKPIPIPAHRAARGKSRGDDQPDERAKGKGRRKNSPGGDNEGNTNSLNIEKTKNRGGKKANNQKTSDNGQEKESGSKDE